jgi:5-formyltetrahydrofolate cyclo-ligase
MSAKSDLRLRMKVLRDAQPPEEIAARSREAVQRLLTLPELSLAAVQNRFVTLYHAIRSELDPISAVAELARRGARILLPSIIPDPENTASLAFGEVPPEVALVCDESPRALADWLDPGAFGLLEPSLGSLIPVEQLRRELACMVLPGLAFDAKGYRLGYGKGYYDGFIGRMDAHVPLVAPTFDFQLLDGPIPAEPHDIPVDVIVTPTRLVRVDARSRTL